MSYRTLQETTMDTQLLTTQISLEKMTVFRKKSLSGESFYAYLGNHQFEPNYQPDMSCYRNYFKKDLVVVYNSSHEILAQIKKKSLINHSFIVFKENKSYGAFHTETFLAKTNPRKICLLVPKMDEENTLIWENIPNWDQVKALVKKESYPNTYILKNEPPIYKEDVGCNVLAFKQKKGLPSIKNSKFIHKNQIVLEGLRMNKNNFGLLFTHPISPVLAFSFLVTQCWFSD